jgi:ATP-dependent helicase/nuclease subunit A
VALTRAQSWLIVCGAGKAEKDTSWYAQVARGMERAGATQVEGRAGPMLRLTHGDWPADGAPARPEGAQVAALPVWAARPAPKIVPPPAPLSPSSLGGAKALPGEGAGRSEAEAMAHGTRLHLLLEHLPGHPPAAWAGVAAQLLAEAAEAERALALADAERVLRAPALAALFAEPALTEVEVTAELSGRRMLGTIDRLIVAPDRIRVIDYKSNTVVPARPEEVPEGLLRQMGAYAAALAQIYPGRPVETAILWTAVPVLMPLPPHLVAAALAATSLP